MAKRTAARVDSRGVTIQQDVSDAPVLPVAQMERLQAFRPDLVDWVVRETTKEAESRRRELSRTNTFIFIERLAGQILAFALGVLGIVGGGYIALKGQPGAGGSIAVAMITGLAVAFLKGKGNKPSEKDAG